MKFTEFGFDEHLMEALGYMGFVEATPIQERAIPIIISGKDLIGCAQTGTGKTGAFILPTLYNIANSKGKGINTLIVVPTRELAIQIDQQIQGFAYFTQATSYSIYGGGDGADWDSQKKALTQGTDIIVATPGKLLSHLNMGYVDLSTVEHFILDEADRMLDIGFHDDILKIAEYLPKVRQNLLFSATMPDKIRKFAKKILKDPEEISIAIAKPAAGVLQAAYLCYDAQKINLVNKLIADKPNYESIIIFSSSKKKVSEIVRSLKSKKYDVEGISSDYDQKQREEVINRFRSRSVRVLVGTDVISRGIDIKDINLVINFDVPKDAADYVHRVGRTARANTTGVALTLITEDDMYLFDRIERLIETEITKVPVPAELGPSPIYNPKSGGNRGYRKGGYKGSGKRQGRRPKNARRN
ncbi:MAG: DEAD/DEAH box helicase [Bacteroidia bacterium]|nr:DEAD/DEAH box helicase [Bacteroidia bacterium]